MKLFTIISQLAIACLVFILVACSNQSEKKLSQKQFDVAILLMSDMYMPLSAEGLKEGMKELGYKEGENVRYHIYNAKGGSVHYIC